MSNTKPRTTEAHNSCLCPETRRIIRPGEICLYDPAVGRFFSMWSEHYKLYLAGRYGMRPAYLK